MEGIIIIATILFGITLLPLTVLQPDKDFRLHWKKYSKFHDFTLCSIVSLLFCALNLFLMIIFVCLWKVLGLSLIWKIILIIGVVDFIGLFLVKVIFSIADIIIYNRRLTLYIQETYDIVLKQWIPEDPIKPENQFFEYEHIKRKIKRLEKQLSKKETKNKE